MHNKSQMEGGGGEAMKIDMTKQLLCVYFNFC